MKILILALITIFFEHAHAQVVSISTAGNGCPSGATSASISPDGKAVSILFDQYMLLVKKGGQQNSQCGVRLSVKVSPGKRVLVNRIDYRYFSELPVGSRLMFFTSVIHANPGTSSEILPRHDLRRDSYGDAFGSTSGDKVQTHSFFWSPLEQNKIKCGASYDLLVSSIVDLSDTGTMPLDQEAQVTIDSLDSGFIQYSFTEVKCRK